MLLCPLIFIINPTGIPARNSLVQKGRLQVCDVIHLYLGFVSTIRWLPFLYECVIGCIIPAKFAIVLMCRLNSGFVCGFTPFWKRFSSIFFASGLNGITTQWFDFCCFLYNMSPRTSASVSCEKSENRKPVRHPRTVSFL